MSRVFFSFFLIFTFLSSSAILAKDEVRVLHSKLIKIYDGETITVKANVINVRLANYIILHYKNINDKKWSEKEMNPKDGFYVSEVSPKEMGKVGIVYYIEVIDNEGKSIQGFASKDAPQYVDIVEKDNNNTFADENNLSDEDKAITDEFEVFLEEEEEEKVVTASKYAQKKSAAPANISVVSHKDIKERGYQSLVEILRDEGFDVNDNGSWADIGLRGVNDTATYGKYLLIFIDGHNITFTQFYRNIVSKGLIALEDIQRIEIQKGPGSSIWGANALQGVINIVTKNFKSKNSLTNTFGTHETFKNHIRVAKEIDKNISIYASILTYQEDISKDMIIKEWSEVAGEDVKVDNMSNRSYTLFGKFKLWDFKLVSSYNRYDPYAPITTFSVGGDDTRLVTDRFYNSLNYDKELINDKSYSLSVNATLSHDKYSFSSGAQYEANPYDSLGNTQFIRKMKALDYRYEGKAYSTLVLKPLNTTVLAGLDYEYLRATRWYYPEVFEDAELAIPKKSQSNRGYFLQAEVNFIKMISVVAGARYDKNSNYNAQLSPKASLVITPGDFFFKAIWGQGYKAPSVHELYYFRKNARYGNPSLSPERSNSIEIQAGYNKKGLLDLELTFFKSGIENVISYKEVTGSKELDTLNEFPENQRPDGTTSYSQQKNQGEYKTMGGEILVKVYPTKKLKFNLKAGYNIAEREGIEDKFVRKSRNTFSTTETEDPDKYYRLNYGQQYFVSFAANYKLLKKYNFNVSGRYTSDKLTPSKVLKEDGNVNNPTEDTTLSTDPYLTLNLAIAADDLFIKGLNLSFKIENLLNKRFYDAGKLALYPQTGIRVFGAIKYQF